MQHHHLTPAEWDSVARDPEFRALLHARRIFTVPATLFFAAYYFALPLGVGFAPQIMNRPVWGPVTIAYAFAFSQFAMVWILCAVYMNRAKRFDEMAARIVERTKSEVTP